MLCAGAAIAVEHPGPAPDALATAGQLRDRALAGHTVAWDLVESLTTEIGARPTGSPAMEHARDWAIAKMTALGFAQVHAEPFVKEHAWQRGAESAAISFPVRRPLAILGLGGSVPTPAAGIEAEVVVFASLDSLKAAAPGSLAGRIAVVNQPMTRTQDGEGYGHAVRARADGPSIAAARGALAFLTRSIATGTARAPHTGGTRYADGVQRIPAAALGIADAELLARLAARGIAPRVQLRLESTDVPQTAAWNVVGEVPGRDPLAGTIVIGGHLDSWDPGDGAVDNGAGVAITMAAARLIAELPLRPKRTIRVVAWGSEETGGSGSAYAKAHAAEAAHLVVASESDLGTGRIFRLALPKDMTGNPLLPLLAEVLSPLRILVRTEPTQFGGSDVEELHDAGVPVFGLQQDASGYFDIHHSADDTLDKINRADLDQNVAAWAALLYIIGDSSVDFR
jgi:Zn-dependent M28 family amino/carboxypeptidase